MPPTWFKTQGRGGVLPVHWAWRPLQHIEPSFPSGCIGHWQMSSISLTSSCQAQDGEIVVCHFVGNDGSLASLEGGLDGPWPHMDGFLWSRRCIDFPDPWLCSVILPSLTRRVFGFHLSVFFGWTIWNKHQISTNICLILLFLVSVGPTFLRNFWGKKK